MKKMNSSKVFFITLLLLIIVLIISSYHFFSQMNSNYILIHGEVMPVRHVVDNYKYHRNIKGLVFSLSFLVAGLSFMIMILLPSDKGKALHRLAEAPQPMQAPREESGISAPVEAPQAPELQEMGIEEAPPDAPPEAPDEPDIDAIPELEDFAEDVDTEVIEGDDDVVYGTGPISSRAIMNFVHRFPDSALKFLYRRQLDGKLLSRADDEIYAEWERRGMTRGKVKAYIMGLLDWKKMPKKPLYEIWKMLRDHIYDNIEMG